eukprot:1919431-Pleurochrysis_carterae.AAC.1
MKDYLQYLPSVPDSQFSKPPVDFSMMHGQHLLCSPPLIPAAKAANAPIIDDPVYVTMLGPALGEKLHSTKGKREVRR